MKLKLLASGVAALAMLAVASASNPAEARHGGHGFSGGRGWAPHFSGARSFAGPRHFAVRRFHHHRRFTLVGGYAYGDGCYWLRRRALHTGSSYWWHRYQACRHGYY